MQRIVRGSVATLTATFEIDDAPASLDADPTVTVAKNGSPVTVTPVTYVADGTYSVFVTAGQSLGLLTAEWAGEVDNDPVTVTTYAEIVGAEYFTLRELRNADSVLLNTTKYPDDKLRDARLATAVEFEGICGRSFVPRYARETIVGAGNGVLWLSNPDPLRLISCTVNGDDWSDRALTRSEDNRWTLSLDEGVFPRDGQVAIEYEYGFPYPPIRVKNAALKRTKHNLVAGSSRIDERATVMNVPDFGNFVLATPGVRGSHTGIPEVDVVLSDYAIGAM